MLTPLYNWFTSLFYPAPIHLAIVRRYTDANGNYIGELYMERNGRQDMIGVSLDNLSVDTICANQTCCEIDTRNDFLAPMDIPNTIRVGSHYPEDNDIVRAMIARIPRRRIELTIYNCFIEKPVARLDYE